MQLSVKELARLFHVSDRRIYRWIASEELPASKINGAYWCNRVDVLEWATAHGRHLSPTFFHETPAPTGSPSATPLTEAIIAGGVHFSVTGNDPQTVLHSIVQLLPLPPGTDRRFLLQALLMRESLGSTGIGDGIAIPHVRNPIIVRIDRPVVSLCFLKSPIEFGAIDGRPVKILFVILSNSVRSHLQILARLTFILAKGPFRKKLNGEMQGENIIAAIREAEMNIGPVPGENP